MTIKDLIGDALEKRQQERGRKPRQKKRYLLTGLPRAQAWALDHFNANVTAEINTLLDRPSFQVRFEGDKMFTTPQLYGESFGFEVEYVLGYDPIGPVWIGRNPMTGLALPLLWVTGKFYENGE